MSENWSGIKGVVMEDMAMALSQGAIADRSKEHLVPADQAVVRCRRQLLESAKRVAEGGDPIGVEVDVSTIRAIDATVPGNVRWQDLVAPERSRSMKRFCLALVAIAAFALAGWPPISRTRHQHHRAAAARRSRRHGGARGRPEAQERLGQPVTIDNKPGALGLIGAEIGAHAKPDGYTIVMVSSGLAIQVATQPKTVQLRRPQGSLSRSPMRSRCRWSFAANPSAPFKTMKEFVDTRRPSPARSRSASARASAAPRISRSSA